MIDLHAYFTIVILFSSFIYTQIFVIYPNTGFNTNEKCQPMKLTHEVIESNKCILTKNN